MSILQGSVYAAIYTFAGGSSAGSAAVLTVTAPDGSTSTPAVTVAGLTASASVPASQVGTYLLVWTISGTVVDVQQDQFTSVKPSLDLVSLGDLRDNLNIATNDPSMNGKLRRFLKAATAVVENICGPVLPVSRTDVFDGGFVAVVLPYKWVVSIQTVTENRGSTNYTLTNQPLGASVDSYGYTWDPTVNKIIRRYGSGGAGPFAPGPNAVSVTYMVGMAAIPDVIQQATLELIRHWWSYGQQPRSGAFASIPSGGDDTGEITVMGYSVPNRVLELLAPFRRRPAIF